MWRKECKTHFGLLLLVGGCLAMPNPILKPENLQTFGDVETDNESAPCLHKRDPNLCTKDVKVNMASADKFGFELLEESFKELNLTIPSELLSNSKTESVCCDGYGRQSDHELCQPLCSQKCERNSFCSKPNVCECVMGYENFNGTCRRLCASTCTANSYCGNGKYCDCNDGYELLNGDCLSSEEILKLNELALEDPNLCTKTIEIEIKYCIPPTWLHLKEIFDELNIQFPNDLFTTTKTEVEKFCCEGYEKRDGKPLCQPVCPANCGEHSFCGESGLCECEINYQVSTNGSCIKNTADFQLEDPHLCRTKETVTYVDQSNLNLLLRNPKAARALIRNKVQVQLECCHGYQQPEKGALCQPNCISSLCMEGYQKDEFGNCKPICTDGCPAQSHCYRPEECQCNIRYSNTTGIDNVFSCQPVCVLDIPEHSICVRPEEWECEIGYTKLITADDLEFYCAPHCEKSCFQFSKCVQPNTCQCLPGYKPIDESSQTCVPIQEAEIDSQTEGTPVDFENIPDFSFRSV